MSGIEKLAAAISHVFARQELREEYRGLSAAERQRMEDEGANIWTEMQFNWDGIERQIERAATDQVAFEVVKRVATIAVGEGAEMPDCLRVWAAKHLAGITKGPKSQGPNPDEQRKNSGPDISPSCRRRQSPPQRYPIREPFEIPWARFLARRSIRDSGTPWRPGC